jgi:hypothetical protein
MRAPCLLLLLCGLLLTCASAQEQNSGRVEFFGGYSYTRYSVFGLYSGPWTGYGFTGWEASAAVKLVPHLDAEADFVGGGVTSANGPYNLHTYMAGPRISADFRKVRVFGHVLFGALSLDGTTTSANASPSFAADLGGGADFWLVRHLGIRLIQADYFRNINTAAAQTAVGGSGPAWHYHISTGVVVRF